MVDVSSQNKTISVNVSSSGVSSNVNASGDTTLYYSNKAREWAISNRIVDGVDYSSKYYAGEANESALSAQSFAQSALETLNNVDNKVQEATDNIEIQKQNVITEIENLSEQEQNKIIDLGIETRANVDLSNLSTTGQAKFDEKAYANEVLKKNQITNCITEIPQNIKLDLTDGVLTLKAGSKVTVPNGFEEDGTTPKFDEIVIEDDLTSNWSSGAYTLSAFFRIVDGVYSITAYSQSPSGSGSTEPTGNSNFYNTSTNTVYRYNGGTKGEQMSFPLAIVTSDANGYVSIDQVFNGMGYIGSTIWVDKGVKGLIPDGRNEDGSLKNIEFVCNKLSTRTFNDTVNTAIIFIGDEGIARLSNTTYRYDADTNYNKNVDVNWQALFIATLTTTSGIISNFQPKQPFRAIDYSDKSEVSGFAMPSDRYINLTLGATNTTYTAPANGWFYLIKTASASGQYIQFRSYTTNLISKAISVGTTDVLCIFIPVKNKQALYVDYSAQGATNYFRFIYAEGEV